MSAPRLLLVAVAVFFAAQASAGEVDWSKVPSEKLLLFYPGVTSWEFLNGDDHRLGGREIKKGKKDCRHCHLSKEGVLDLKTDEIASGVIRMKRSHNPFEPEPAAGKKGSITARVQAAYDSSYLYMRVEWDSSGAGWRKKDGTPDRVSMQMNSDEPSFKKYGCFITCHNDLSTMPGSPSKREVSSHPGYNGRDDVRLYAFYAKDSWAESKGRQELEKRLRSGGLIDLKAVEFEDGKASGRDGWVFDDRGWEENQGEGAGAWSNGKYWAVLKVRLSSKERHDLEVSEGDSVSVGLAIHDDGASKRKHYVSFPVSVGLNASADIKAVKVPD